MEESSGGDKWGGGRSWVGGGVAGGGGGGRKDRYEELVSCYCFLPAAGATQACDLAGGWGL